jgi:hypothetical protein
MLLRERTNQDTTPNATASQPTGGQLDQIRQDAERFAAAGDEAIRRALSTDSSAFLAATRQSGGQ